MTRDYIENCPVKAPGLVIKAGSSAIVKAANAFAVKANGILSANISANQDMTGLASALGVNGVASSNLADGYTRVYTFLASINAVTGAPTYSAVFGNDFATASRAVKSTDFNFGNAVSDSQNNTSQDAKKSIIGFLIVSTSGAAFVPGTTALDAGTVTARYIDNYGFVGM